ncbi:MAG: hypothetical protein HQK77_08075 [Desulfobacterales bacterium]|nr:hypothetical protein [Desulfobacterales bacterium]
MEAKDTFNTPIYNRGIVWIWILVVFLAVLGILLAIYNQERIKPTSPHALVATAFNQMFTTKEWKPGLGPQPLIYHPAAATTSTGLMWQPLPKSSRWIKHNSINELWPRQNQ